MTFLPPFSLRWGQQSLDVDERQGLSSPAIPLHPGMRDVCLHHCYPKAVGQEADEGPVAHSEESAELGLGLGGSERCRTAFSAVVWLSQQ